MIALVRSKSSLAECQSAFAQYRVEADRLREEDPHAPCSVGTCKNPLPIEQRTEINDAATAAAGASGNALAKLQFFLAMGASVDSHSFNAHKSALAWSISARNQDCFKLLLAKGAFVGTSDGAAGQTGTRDGKLLHISQKTMCKLARTKRGDDEMSLFFTQQLVLAGANFMDLDKSGHTVLQCAVMGGHVLGARFLIDKAPRHLHDKCANCCDKGLIHHVGNACPNVNCFHENCDVYMLLTLVMVYKLDYNAVYIDAAGRTQGLALCLQGRTALQDALSMCQPSRVGRVPALKDFLVNTREPATPVKYTNRLQKRAATQVLSRMKKAAKRDGASPADAEAASEGDAVEAGAAQDEPHV
jgi:hypothetical protein